MTWQAPKIVPRKVTRTAYGFDQRGQVVSDVSGKALRAMHEAMQLTLEEKYPPPHTEMLQQATQVWRDALNASIPEDSPFSEAWIKSTSQGYSLEFYFLADAYARQICGDDECYMRHLVAKLLPPALQEISQSVSLAQLYRTSQLLFQNGVQIQLETVRVSGNAAQLRWNVSSQITRVAVDYRRELQDMLRLFIRTMLQQLPVLVKQRPPAEVTETMPDESIAAWQVKWHEVRYFPRWIIVGAII